MVSMFHFSKKCGFFSRFHEFPCFFNDSGTCFCFGTQVYKPMLGCIGEFPTVAVGGVLRVLGFIFMSMAKTPVTPGPPFGMTEAEAHGNGFTVAKIYGVCQPTIKIWLSQLYSSDIS
jgi:hypothetical protein